MRIGKPFWTSNLKWKGLILLASVLALLSLTAGVNVFVSYIASKFTTALQAKDAAGFQFYLFAYALTMIGGSPVVVFYQYLRTKLALTWRKWLTEHFLERYFKNKLYYRLTTHPEIDNPDERMSQDVETFCNSAVGLFIACLDALVTVVSFLGVLWFISAPLTVVAILYSLIGCLLTIFIGKRLVGLQFQHTKREADLRYTLAEVRRDAETIAFYRGERSSSRVVLKRLAEAIINLESMMILQRNITIFTQNFNSLIVLIPAAVIAPLYFAGSMQFGELTQAAIAFGQVFGGMTLLIGQFTGISAFISNIDRLGSFVETLDEMDASRLKSSKIERSHSDDGRLSLQDLTVIVPDSGRLLVDKLNLTIKPGENLLIMGKSGSGKSSILRAIAGIWESGQGKVELPREEQTLFLPQRPYVPRSTLREALLYPLMPHEYRQRFASDQAAEDKLKEVLKLVNLSGLDERAAGLDKEVEWREMLSIGEQQRLTIARALLSQATMIFLDEATSALDAENEKLMLDLLQEKGTTLISVGHKESLKDYHSLLLELMPENQTSASYKISYLPANKTRGLTDENSQSK